MQLNGVEETGNCTEAWADGAGEVVERWMILLNIHRTISHSEKCW